MSNKNNIPNFLDTIKKIKKDQQDYIDNNRKDGIEVTAIDPLSLKTRAEEIKEEFISRFRTCESDCEYDMLYYDTILNICDYLDKLTKALNGRK